MTDREVLVAARKLVERGWTQRAYARDSVGRVLFFPNVYQAVCWCAEGAVAEVCGFCTKRFYRIVAKLEQVLEVVNLTDFNDAPGRTKEEVLAVFDRAIEAESEVAA